MSAARLADLALIVFVGLYIMPGAVLMLADLVIWLTTGHPVVPYPAPPWPAGS